MKNRKKLLFIFGTRPEAIKMAPLIKILDSQKEQFDISVCTTGQHREMLQQIMDFFQLRSDYDLALMKPNQTLFDITSDSIQKLEKVLKKTNPDLVLVQGDTTTAMTGALAAFYQKIKVAHIEAGLRSFDKYAPFPEEINRKIISTIADFNFTPTEQSKKNLEKENITKNVYVTGNTVIDALLWGVNKVRTDAGYQDHFDFLDSNKKTILVTAHRRENFGEPFEHICDALYELADKFNTIQIVYPVHLNPNVQEIVYKKLKGHPAIHLISPLDYPRLLWIMDKSYFVITDSGGIQEEAPSLGKPVLVMRDVTERMEGIEAGNAILTGTSTEKILFEASRLLTDKEHYDTMSKAINPYGTGKSAEIIVSILSEKLND
jgi:UDP-N-acetylglucosamine 2-epimerase (non-hydrolysing)